MIKKRLLYTGIILTFLFIIINYYLKYDSRANELNALLISNTELAAYPYKYRVLQVNDGIAVMTSLSSSQLSVLHALEIIYPKLRFKAPNSFEIKKAKQEMQRYQEIAARQIRAQDDITTIRWQIDSAWFTKHGIEIENLCNMHNLADRYIVPM